MRTGACTLPQALSAEAATILKHSLALARRRGHAHVTPLHVAASLLSSSSTSASALLRRACLKSQPHQHPASHPLRCRALELCFNVALNRLPTTAPPPSSPPLLGAQAHPSLSNALVAALKRAQAHQRRGCIELQQQQPPSSTKVELEQLIISILDDPNVSRVMREAGFSSTCVKNNLEDSSPFPLELHRRFHKNGSSVPQSEDLSAVLEAMLRKQGRRANIVVVGDSVSGTEGIVAELIARVERGEVPDELKAAHVVRLHLSYVHLRLMSRSDVDVKVSDLRRKIAFLGSGCVIICAGDLRWAVDEETKDGCRFEPVGHMVAELGRLLSELSSSISKVWLLATASYQTYIRCQMRQPSLEIQWALQAVVVPSGGLALNLQGPSGIDSRLTKHFECYPLRLLGEKSLTIEDDEKIICCAECTSKFEKEFSSWTDDTNCGSTQLPCWLQQRLNPDSRKDDLQKSKRKWNSLCKDIHHSSHSNPHFLNQSSSIGKSRSSTCSSSYLSWSSCHRISKSFLQPNPFSLTETTAKLDRGFLFCNSQKLRLSEVNLHSLKTPGNDDKGVILSLGSAIASGLVTPNEHKDLIRKQHELTQKLQEQIPWQSKMIPFIVDAISRKCKPSESKGIRVLLQGSDYISKRRLAELLPQYFGATDDDSIMRINMTKQESKSSLSCCEIFKEAKEHETKHMVLIENVDLVDVQSIRSLIDILKLEALVSSVFIITTINSASIQDNDDLDNAIKIKIMIEDPEPMINRDVKRKQEEIVAQSKSKRPKTGDYILNLNLLAEEEREGIPPLHPELLELVTAQFTLDVDPERSNLEPEKLISKLHFAFEKMRSAGSEGNGQLLIDEEAANELAKAVSSLWESIFERWVREVFQTFIQTVKNGGNFRLCVEGKEGNIREFGFMDSVLPKRIHMD